MSDEITDCPTTDDISWRVAPAEPERMTRGNVRRALALAVAMAVSSVAAASACRSEGAQPASSPAGERASASAPPTASEPVATAAQTPAPVQLDPVPTRHRDAPRIVAIGDLHGDLDATRRVLRLARAIDDDDRWIGGSLVVVQTGDQLDRGDDERAILDLLKRLSEEARQAGGAVGSQDSA